MASVGARKTKKAKRRAKKMKMRKEMKNHGVS
jgi:hypothetical protein